MNNISRPIGVFDSGVGGLSIYQELKKQLPNENFVYLADQKNAPYGTRSPSEIQKLTMKCLNFLVNPPASYVLRTTYYVPIGHPLLGSRHSQRANLDQPKQKLFPGNRLHGSGRLI